MTLGAEAVGGVLSTVVVPVTVEVTVFVSACKAIGQKNASNENITKIFFTNLALLNFLNLELIIIVFMPRCKNFYTSFIIINYVLNTNMDQKSGNEEQDFIWEQFDSIFGEISKDMNKSLPEEVEKLERTSIVNALQSHDGNRTRTAEYLGIGRTCLIAKIRKYDLIA